MTTALAARPAPPSALRIARARTLLEVRLYFRERQQVVFGYAYPLVMLVIFAAVLGGDERPGGVPFTHYFLAGIAATGIMLTSFQAVGSAVAAEREAGGLERLQLLGTPPVAYFAGKAGQVLVTAALQLALLLPLAQSAAAWHAYSHVASAGARDDAGAAHAAAHCDLCLTAAAAGAPGLPGTAPSFAAPAQMAQALPDTAAPCIARGGRAAYRSRAPPSSSH